MNNYVTRQEIKEFAEDIKRYVGIFMEDNDKKLSLIAERLDSLIDSHEQLTESHHRLRESHGMLAIKVDALDEKVNAMHIELIAHRDNTELYAMKKKTRKKAG